MVKLIYIAFGWLALGLGVLGAFLPILPTTPFLLLALFCFGRSSVRLQQWMMKTWLYQKYLKEFDENRAMTMKQKITILAIAFPFTAFAFWSVPHWGGKVFLIVLMMIQYWYFFCCIKTIKS